MTILISRRSFLAISAFASASGLIPAPTRAGRPTQRVLGRTGLKVSEVGMGMMLTTDPSVVRAALYAGINYFDTARSYMGGKSEEILAQGLKGHRNEAVLATKCHRLGRKSLIQVTAENSLQALKTDVIDVLQLHGLSSAEEVLLDDHLEALETLRKEGKIRFAGISTHSNMIEVIEAAIKAGVYDVVSTVFNFRNPPGMEEAVDKAASAGVGVVAMKAMTGGYIMKTMPGLNHFQSALRWVLEHKSVASAIPSMFTLEQLKENAAVMGTTYSWRDNLSLQYYASAVDGRYCRACGSCSGQCPRGVNVREVMRALMYAEGYRNTFLALEILAGGKLPCTDCDSCSVTCRFGINVPVRVSAAVKLAEKADV